jgi:hypothetical protein
VFGKGKLLEQGAEVDGLVIDARFHATGEGGVGDKYKVTVRVRFEDGSSTEITRKLSVYAVGAHREGSIVPLRYDPNDRSKIEIDEPALKATRDANSARAKELAVAEGERRLQGDANYKTRTADYEARMADYEARMGPDGYSLNPKADMVRLLIAKATRKGDTAEIERLTAMLADLEHGAPGPAPQ